MSTGRNRGKPLELRGNVIASSVPSDMKISYSSHSQTLSPSVSSSSSNVSTPLSGAVLVRREVKGRGGHPVFVLYGFSRGNASPENLKALKTFLCTRLGCGGSVDAQTVIVVCEQAARLAKLLREFGFSEIKGLPADAKT